MIVSARTHLEAISRFLITQGWRLTTKEGFCDMRLEPGPVQSVTGVRKRDAGGGLTLLDPAAWQLDLSADPTLLRLAEASAIRRRGCLHGWGYGRPDEVPVPLRHALHLRVAS
jgi:uncharacterized phiE125 gp8 family phage protein